MTTQYALHRLLELGLVVFCDLMLHRRQAVAGHCELPPHGAFVLGADLRESIALLRNILLLLEQRFCDIRPKTIMALITACKQRGLSARQLLDPVVGNEIVDSCVVYVKEEVGDE